MNRPTDPFRCWILFACCLSGLFFSCERHYDEHDHHHAHHDHIVVTFFPLHAATTALVRAAGAKAAGVHVVLLGAHGQGCLHDYTLTVRDTSELYGARRLVINGIGMENGALLNQIKQLDQTRVIDASALIPAKRRQQADPHVHLVPRFFKQQMAAIAAGLVAYRPEWKHAIDSELTRVNGKLMELSQRLKVLSAMGEKTPIALTSLRPSFVMLLEQAGFRVVDSFYEEDHLPPSAKQVYGAIDRIKAKKVRRIIFDRHLTSQYLDTLVAKSGIQALGLDALAIAKPSGESLDELLTRMERNIEILEQLMVDEKRG